MYAALQDFRKNARTNLKTVPLLWADALCINQDDDTEKAHQMYAIYTRASAVFVPVGAPSADFENMGLICSLFQTTLQSFLRQDLHLQVSLNSIRSELLPKILEVMRTSEERHRLAASDESLAILLDQLLVSLVAIRFPSRMPTLVDDLRRVGADRKSLPYTRAFWGECSEFYLLEYFFRLWTYQEVRLSYAVHVSLGSRVVHWPIVAAMYLVFFVLARTRLLTFRKSSSMIEIDSEVDVGD